MSAKILTANNLRSGGVIFLTPRSEWSPFISQAEISNDDDTAEKLQSIADQAVGEQIIVGPFFIDVRIEGAIPVPVRFRERLRVSGPSTRAEFLKPAFLEVA